MTLGILLLVAWVLGFFVFHVLGGLIHLALIIGLAFLVWHWVASRSHGRQKTPSNP